MSEEFMQAIRACVADTLSGMMDTSSNAEHPNDEPEEHYGDQMEDDVQEVPLPFLGQQFLAFLGLSHFKAESAMALYTSADVVGVDSCRRC